MATISIKLVCVGDTEYEKTNLLRVFSHQTPVGSLIYELFDNYSSNIMVDGKQVALGLWDVAPHSPIRTLQYPDTDVVLMCFSIGSPRSFEVIPHLWKHEIKRFCKNVPIVLVGTRKDLRNDEHTKRELARMRQEPINMMDGQKMAKRIKAHAYLECSINTPEDVVEVTEVFITATKVALQAKNEKKKGCTLL